jgi:hypothetical protein
VYKVHTVGVIYLHHDFTSNAACAVAFMTAQSEMRHGCEGIICTRKKWRRIPGFAKWHGKRLKCLKCLKCQVWSARDSLIFAFNSQCKIALRFEAGGPMAAHQGAPAEVRDRSRVANAAPIARPSFCRGGRPSSNASYWCPWLSWPVSHSAVRRITEFTVLGCFRILG